MPRKRFDAEWAEPRPGETESQFDAFTAWLHMPRPRECKRLAETDSRWTKTTLWTFRRNHDWVARAKAFDTFMARAASDRARRAADSLRARVLEEALAEIEAGQSDTVKVKLKRAPDGKEHVETTTLRKHRVDWLRVLNTLVGDPLRKEDLAALQPAAIKIALLQEKPVEDGEPAPEETEETE